MTTNTWKQDRLRALNPEDLRMIQVAVKDYIDANDELHSYSPSIDWSRDRAGWELLLLRINMAFYPILQTGLESTRADPA